MKPLHPLVAQLQARRLELGISRQKIAKACGVHINTVTRWDTGEKAPSLENLVAYAEAVGYELGLSDRPGHSRQVPATIRRRRDILREVELVLGNAELRSPSTRPVPAGTGPEWQTVAAASTQEAIRAGNALTWALRARELLGKVLITPPGHGLRRALLLLAAGILAWLEDIDNQEPNA